MTKEKLTVEEAKKLLSLSDRELAKIGNRYSYNPTITVISNNYGKVEVREEKAEDWAKIWLDGWSDEGTEVFLKEKIGVKVYSIGKRDGEGDAECDRTYSHESGKERWGTFKLNGYRTYYDFECYVPVIRWGLKHLIEEG